MNYRLFFDPLRGKINQIIQINQMNPTRFAVRLFCDRTNTQTAPTVVVVRVAVAAVEAKVPSAVGIVRT